MKPPITKRCRGCNAPLSFVMDEDGKLVPLDLREPVYEVATDFNGDPAAKLVQEGFYASHFSTCPKANELSASSKERRQK